MLVVIVNCTQVCIYTEFRINTVVFSGPRHLVDHKRILWATIVIRVRVKLLVHSQNTIYISCCRYQLSERWREPDDRKFFKHFPHCCRWIRFYSLFNLQLNATIYFTAIIFPIAITHDLLYYIIYRVGHSFFHLSCRIEFTFFIYCVFRLRQSK